MLTKILPKIDIFRGLNEPQANELLSWFERRTYPEFQLIFKEGEAPDGLFILCKGSVAVVKSTSKGHVRLAELKAPSFFGEMALLLPANRSAGIRAQTEVLVGFMPKEKFQAKLDENNLTALRVSLNLARLVADRLNTANTQLAILSARLGRMKSRSARA